MLAVAERPVTLDLDAIRTRREKLGLTMEQAADAGGFAGKRQAWYMIESGRRPNVTIETLNQIAKALRCPAKDLLK